MKTRRILPVSCRYSLGLFSPRDGTPGKRDRPSTRDSARTSRSAPQRARLRNRNCMSQDAVGDGLQEHDEEEDSASNVDFEPEEHHAHASQLADEVHHDEHGGEEPTAPPGDVHVLPLLAPLDPHPDPVLEEGGHEAEARQMGEDMLGMTGNLVR